MNEGIDLRMTAKQAASDLRAEASRMASSLAANAESLGQRLVDKENFDPFDFDALKSDVAAFVDVEIRGTYFRELSILSAGQLLGQIPLFEPLPEGKYRVLVLMNRVRP